MGFMKRALTAKLMNWFDLVCEPGNLQVLQGNAPVNPYKGSKPARTNKLHLTGNVNLTQNKKRKTRQQKKKSLFCRVRNFTFLKFCETSRECDQQCCCANLQSQKTSSCAFGTFSPVYYAVSLTWVEELVTVVRCFISMFHFKLVADQTWCQQQQWCQILSASV